MFFLLPNSQITPWSRNNRRSFLSAVQVQAVMSVNRCIHLFSRFQRHISTRAARTSTGSRHVSPGSVSVHNQHYIASLSCSRNASSNSSPPKPPDTSLFVPVSLKTDFPVDGSVGSELSQPLDKSERINMSHSFKCNAYERCQIWRFIILAITLFFVSFLCVWCRWSAKSVEPVL